MRAGKLNLLASVISTNGDDIGAVLVGVDDKDASIPFDSGLKNEGKIIVRARYHPEIKAGCYFKAIDNRLFYVMNPRDPNGRNTDLLCSVTELAGASVEVDLSSPQIVRCALLPYVSKPDSQNDYLPAAERRQAEFANIEWRPEVGVEFDLAGAIYRITEIDADHSDSVVTRVWVEFIKYAAE